jgi:hypothetical protein
VATFVQNPIKKDSKLPFILDILPHLQVGDIAPGQNLRLALEHWTLTDRSHLVADAAFGGMDVMQDVMKWGGVATMSCSTTMEPWLWELLATNLPSGKWRCAVQE